MHVCCTAAFSYYCCTTNATYRLIQVKWFTTVMWFESEVLPHCSCCVRLWNHFRHGALTLHMILIHHTINWFTDYRDRPRFMCMYKILKGKKVKVCTHRRSSRQQNTLTLLLKRLRAACHPHYVTMPHVCSDLCLFGGRSEANQKMKTHQSNTSGDTTNSIDSGVCELTNQRETGP